MFGLYPPSLIFDIEIKVEKQAYTTEDGNTIIDHLDTLIIGPEQRVVTSSNVSVSFVFFTSIFLHLLCFQYLKLF